MINIGNIRKFDGFLGNENFGNKNSGNKKHGNNKGKKFCDFLENCNKSDENEVYENNKNEDCLEYHGNNDFISNLNRAFFEEIKKVLN